MTEKSSVLPQFYKDNYENKPSFVENSSNVLLISMCHKYKDKYTRMLYKT